MTKAVGDSATMRTLLAMYQRHWRDQAYERALDVADMALSSYPDSMELFWYRCCCLECLGRHPQALEELDARERAEEERQRKRDEAGEENGDEDAPDSDEHALPELNDQALFLQTLEVMPADVCERMMYWLGNEEKLLPFYDRLIALKPDEAEWVARRGQHFMSQAFIYTEEDQADDDDQIIHQAFSGTRYSKPALEKALSDFMRATDLAPTEYRYPFRAGRVLHLLQRYDEALVVYDKTLERVPQDDPARELIAEQRKASEGGGQGEYDQMADLLAASLRDTVNVPERNAQDDIAYSMMKTLEDALRSGQPLQQASETFLSDSPDDMLALSVARNIFNAANEPPMQLAEVALADFPAYHKRHIRAAVKQFEMLGCRHVGDAEARNLTEMLGQRVAIGFLITRDERSCISVCTLRPKWPGALGFILMLFSGQWRKHRLVEISSRFNDGRFILTRRTTAPDSFSDYGPDIRLEKMPGNVSLEKMLARHEQKIDAFLAGQQDARCIPVRTLADVQEASQEESSVKGAYRRSINYVTEQELKKLLGKNYGRFADKIRQQLGRLAQLHDASVKPEA